MESLGADFIDMSLKSDCPETFYWNSTGIPVLGKIPYLSRLFRNVSTGREAQSLMLMVEASYYPHFVILVFIAQFTKEKIYILSSNWRTFFQARLTKQRRSRTFISINYLGDVYSLAMTIQLLSCE